MKVHLPHPYKMQAQGRLICHTIFIQSMFSKCPITGKLGPAYRAKIIRYSYRNTKGKAVQAELILTITWI